MPRTKAAVGFEPSPGPVNPLRRLAYGVDDTADALSLSRSRIYELIASGEIAACKVGKRTIIPVAELTAFLERHRVERLSSMQAPPPPRPHPVGSQQGRNKGQSAVR